ncbi:MULTISPECIES: sodium/glutamate symporter [unclassified Lentimonas]|uniref:sodium/glutamate symporter n=1 Tax=unclassified Lentimonas TaxID=2630993 RepID=UPI0013273237|nr:MULTISPECIES: sodium/glutamate symporter [unclassified Lentimonas]CAA6676873.1 Sodium/glutamate symporter [Lentimonas sp. CC4]CAA6686680.1 Sodium/glutamate symporter [Lentimonas sp. CC6]CAA7075743.1 Sodium/glutamate symporter [Lentimonas sp. CC4]CAA7168098.1 Sodium/glutamate symporter [Lentimonas sp. CC21]CAA7181754.1 Sodium/glutamate symporter [Lentimonas sp. CC8]
MELEMLTTFNLGIIVLFIGKLLSTRFSILRRYNIPEPVSSGLLICLITFVLYLTTGIEISFDLHARDVLLIYFFAGIGLNSDLRSLLSGGLPLVILLSATIVFMFLQNIAGVGVASLFGLDGAVGVLGGTTSLIGGHGTAIAWTPVYVEQYGITNASEIGIACATFGLVLASLMGGPIANILIKRHKLEPKTCEQPDVGLTHNHEHTKVDMYSILSAWLILNLCLTLGAAIQQGLESAGLDLPLFVCCLFGGIILTNTVPRLFPKLKWPSGTPALALMSDVALGMFLAMSLMSLQLWTLTDLAGPIVAILGVQFILAFCFALFVVFRLMGRDYEAAVICSGFGGISLGSTPTAMANMTAVSKRYGAAHKAFIIVPLVCGFFVDIANALIIQVFLNWFA